MAVWNALGWQRIRTAETGWNMTAQLCHESSINAPGGLGASVLPLSAVSPSAMPVNVSANPEIERIDLPPDVAEAFSRIDDGDEPPRTLQEAFAGVDELLDDGARVDDMYRSEPTRHAVHVGETVEHVFCVLDAMIVALARNTRPIEIQSEPPGGGAPVQFHVTDQEIQVTPDRAVASFGIANEDITDPTVFTEPIDEAVPLPSCSVINAFPDSAAYDRWATAIPHAVVMELAIEDLVAIAQHAATYFETP